MSDDPQADLHRFNNRLVPATIGLAALAAVLDVVFERDLATRFVLAFATGAHTFYVVIGWWLRRRGDESAQGRRVLAHLVVSTVLILLVTSWLFGLLPSPW